MFFDRECARCRYAAARSIDSESQSSDQCRSAAARPGGKHFLHAAAIANGPLGDVHIFSEEIRARLISSFSSFNLLKTIFDQKPPIRLLVDGEEDLLVLPVCLFAPANSVVMYGQPNEGLVIAEITDEVRDKVQKIVNQMK